MEEEIENEEKPIWLNLLVPITELILERLPLPDYIRFGAVCRQWRSIQINHRLRHAPGPPPMPYSLPWLIPYNVNNHLNCYSPWDHTSRRLSLPACFDHCLTSCRGWLLLLYEQSWPQPPNVEHPVLFNPISGAKMLLPPLEQYCYQGAMSAPPTDPDCTVLLIFESKILLHRCLTGGGWTTVASLEDDSEVALTYSQDKFYFMASERTLYAVDHLLPMPALRRLEMDCSMLIMNIAFSFMLVESDGDLLLVEALDERDLGLMVEEYRVFRADFSEKKWVRVETLGDRVLFIDCGQSLSLLAADLGCKENCIYCTRSFLKKNNLVAWRVFDLDSKGWIEEPFTEVEGTRSYMGHWFLPTLDCP